jgi:hypothetical protein
MSGITVTVSSTAAGVSVSGGTAVDIAVQQGVGPAGFIVPPGTATQAFGVFQLLAGDGITISTSAASFTVSGYPQTSVSSLAPVQSVAGRTGAVVLTAADITAGTFSIARIPTISYTALSNVPVKFAPDTTIANVASINGLTGTPQIVAGSNVTVSTGATTITIAASTGTFTGVRLGLVLALT